MVLHLPKTLLSSVKHYQIKRSSSSVGPVSELLFEQILDQYSDIETVFVHIGLSDIKSAFGTNPYEFTMKHLDERFSSILVPGFTKSFRESGVFHVGDSQPELGAFSTLFFENDMEYRTHDPLHSIMVRGEYRFENVEFRDTFSEDGCYGQLEDDNVLCLNIGTQWLISTQLHYLEQVLDVPYVDTVDIGGTVTFRDETSEEIIQTNYHKNKYVYFWNRRKIRENMVENDQMDSYTLNGMRLIAFKMQDLRAHVEREVEKDPYYLVQ